MAPGLYVNTLDDMVMVILELLGPDPESTTGWVLVDALETWDGTTERIERRPTNPALWRRIE